MGPRLSLIAVRMLSKVKKSNRKKPSGMMIRNNNRCYGSIIEGADDYNHHVVRKDAIDSSMLSENQSGICSTVVFGTSNHNFYNIRRSRLVSRLWSYKGNNVMQILSSFMPTRHIVHTTCSFFLVYAIRSRQCKYRISGFFWGYHVRGILFKKIFR